MESLTRASPEMKAGRSRGCAEAAVAPGGGGNGRRPQTAVLAAPEGDGGPSSRLSQIIDTAGAAFLSFEVDDHECTARGMMLLQDNRALTGTLSFDPGSRLFRLEVCLTRQVNPTESLMRSWLRLNGRNGLSRAWFDAEDGVVWLRGATFCHRLDESACFVLKALARDVHRTLNDELLRGTLEGEPYGSRPDSVKVRHLS